MCAAPFPVCRPPRPPGLTSPARRGRGYLLQLLDRGRLVLQLFLLVGGAGLQVPEPLL